MFVKVKNCLFNLFSRKNNSKFKYIIVVVLSVIVVLIFASSFTVSNRKNTKTNQISTTKSSIALEYCTQVENRLVNILEQVKGISNVNVYVVVDASPTIKFLEEVKEEKSEGQENVYLTQNTIVFSKNGSVSSPVAVVEILPEVAGVLIVAKGAGDVKVKTKLVNVVSSVLNVSVSKVEVLEGK